MFTSRAEFRLQLREDNADLRLTEIGRGLGLVDDERWDAFSRHRDRLASELQRLRSTWLRPATLAAADAERLLGKALEHEYSLADLLRRPGVDHDAVCQAAAAARVEPAVSRETLRATWGEREADRVIEQAEIGIKYAGYIDKQVDEVERASHFETLPLPEDMDYASVTALSFEVRQTLARQRPATLGQASRMSGVTPAAVSLLLVHLKKRRARGFAAEQPAAGPGQDQAA
jgi:tRNA uridine 5-carboxymethylaminomethyl modification enzyme